MMKKLLFALLFSASFMLVAQESVFYTKDTLSNTPINKFGLHVYNHNFIKNNEYFNFIADGYTLLATQLHPQFVYQNSPELQFKAGVFVQKNFGESTIAHVLPTFSVHYRNKAHQLTFGNTVASNNHGMIEPLLASEKILSRELIETGIRYQYTKSKWQLDLWLDWEHYIRPNDDFKEVFTLGFQTALPLLPNLSLPVQWLTRHRGGQINKKFRDPRNITDIYDLHNAAIGLQYKFHTSDYDTWNLSSFWLWHGTDAPNAVYPFKRGNAFYATLAYRNRNFNAVLAYFRGSNFIPARGNEMFYSYSLKANVNYWNGVLDNRYVAHQEVDRSLLFTKIYYQKALSKNVVLGAQLEGFLQLNPAIDSVVTQENKEFNFDYSYGVYLRFNEVFKF